MNIRSLVSLIGILVVLGVVAFAIRSTSIKGPSEGKTHIRWLIAHQPADLFVRGTSTFADVLEKETQGSMTLDVLVPEDVGFAGGDVPTDELFKMLDSGSIQLATVYAGGVEKIVAPYGVINLPFLFESYASAEKVLDGPVGENMRSAVEKNTPYLALATTYSGGYRIIASNKKAITTGEDFKGLRIGTAGGPVAEELFKALGAIPVQIPTVASGKGYLTSNQVDAVETAYTRLSFGLASSTYVRYISETNHSLFTTATIVPKSFYGSLTRAQQAALRKAAFAAATVERADSIALAEKTKVDAAARGIEIVELSPAAQTALKERLLPVYKTFEGLFGVDLIQSIVEAQQ